MKYRQAELKDLADVAKLVTLEFAGEIAEEMPYLKEQGNPNKFLNIWNQYIGKSRIHNIFVCYDGDVLAGAAGGYLTTQTYSDGPIYGVEDFWYVKKSYRDKQVGGKLYIMLEEWFRDTGAEKMQMMHYPFSTGLEEHYEKNDFKILETTYVKDLETKPEPTTADDFNSPLAAGFAHKDTKADNHEKEKVLEG